MPRRKPINIRLSDVEKQMLYQLAEHEQVTPSEMVRILIRRAMQEQTIIIRPKQKAEQIAEYA